jgi:DNA-binding PadR family transcriptional regulator
MIEQTSIKGELLDNFLLDLRKGTVVLVLLAQLRQEQYGYALQKSLTKQGMELEQGVIYPLLRRLEKQGLLQSQWRVEKSRPRKYYSISPVGEQLLLALTAEWHTSVASINSLLAG